MTEGADKYPNFPPYDAQIKFYEGSSLKVTSFLSRSTQPGRRRWSKYAQSANFLFKSEYV